MIVYRTDASITTDQFIDLLKSSSLGERRPIEDRKCMEGMVENSNLTVTAWDDEKLIGVARSMTDFHYACYLSDLAVDRAYQNQSVGKKLQQLTQTMLGSKCKLILISAPSVNEYYEKIGFTNNPRCWVLNPIEEIK